jgi:hypothetical protein
VQIRWVAQGGQGGAELGQRQREDALDLCGVDGDGGGADALAEQLLGDQAAEGVPDDDRAGVEGVDDLGVVSGGVVDAGVRY